MIDNNFIWIIREACSFCLAIIFARPLLELSDWLYAALSRSQSKKRHLLKMPLAPELQRTLVLFVILGVILYVVAFLQFIITAKLYFNK